MASLHAIFNFHPVIEESEKKKFIDFIDYNVLELFSDVRNTRYDIDYLTMLSVTNENRPDYQGAKYRKVLLDFTRAIKSNQLNTKYQNMHMAEVFQMLHDGAKGSFIRLMNLIKKFNKDFQVSELQWNKVKYGYLENFEKIGRFVK